MTFRPWQFINNLDWYYSNSRRLIDQDVVLSPEAANDRRKLRNLRLLTVSAFGIIVPVVTIGHAGSDVYEALQSFFSGWHDGATHYLQQAGVKVAAGAMSYAVGAYYLDRVCKPLIALVERQNAAERGEIATAHEFRRRRSGGIEGRLDRPDHEQ